MDLPDSLQDFVLTARTKRHTPTSPEYQGKGDSPYA